MRNDKRTGLDMLLVPPRVEASLWRRLRFEREAHCREQLFTRYRSLARAIARRQHGQRPRQGAELGDLEHFAYEGLLQAIDRFDPLRGIPFGAFARPRIAGSIADGAARSSEADAKYRVRTRLEAERADSLRNPVDAREDPIATLSRLASGLALGLILQGTTLVVGADETDPRPNAYQSLAWRELNALLTAGIADLPEREEAVIRQHYEAGVSFTQIAALLGVSKGRVSQLHAAAIARLRRRLGIDGR